MSVDKFSAATAPLNTPARLTSQVHVVYKLLRAAGWDEEEERGHRMRALQDEAMQAEYSSTRPLSQPSHTRKHVGASTVIGEVTGLLIRASGSLKFGRSHRAVVPEPAAPLNPRLPAQGQPGPAAPPVQQGPAPPMGQQGLAPPVGQPGLAPPMSQQGLAPPMSHQGLAPPVGQQGLAPPMSQPSPAQNQQPPGSAQWQGAAPHEVAQTMPLNHPQSQPQRQGLAQSQQSHSFAQWQGPAPHQLTQTTPLNPAQSQPQWQGVAQSLPRGQPQWQGANPHQALQTVPLNRPQSQPQWGAPPDGHQAGNAPQLAPPRSLPDASTSATAWG